jgi:hypothetical protein
MMFLLIAGPSVLILMDSILETALRRFGNNGDIAHITTQDIMDLKITVLGELDALRMNIGIDSKTFTDYLAPYHEKLNELSDVLEIISN